MSSLVQTNRDLGSLFLAMIHLVPIRASGACTRRLSSHRENFDFLGLVGHGEELLVERSEAFPFLLLPELSAETKLFLLLRDRCALG